MHILFWVWPPGGSINYFVIIIFFLKYNLSVYSGLVPSVRLPSLQFKQPVAQDNDSVTTKNRSIFKIIHLKRNSDSILYLSKFSQLSSLQHWGGGWGSIFLGLHLCSRMLQISGNKLCEMNLCLVEHYFNIWCVYVWGYGCVFFLWVCGILAHNSCSSQVTALFSRTYLAFLPRHDYHTPSTLGLATWNISIIPKWSWSNVPEMNNLHQHHYPPPRLHFFYYPTPAFSSTSNVSSL